MICVIEQYYLAQSKRSYVAVSLCLCLSALNEGRAIKRCAHMSKHCDIEFLCVRRVKKVAATAATAATVAAAAATVAATVATVAAAADHTAVLEYASAAECCKLAAAVSIAHPDEIDAIRVDEIIMTDTASAAAAAADTQKRANFSALTVGNPNGVSKISPSLTNAKPGSAKKLVIKNFRSKLPDAAR